MVFRVYFKRKFSLYNGYIISYSISRMQENIIIKISFLIKVNFKFYKEEYYMSAACSYHVNFEILGIV